MLRQVKVRALVGLLAAATLSPVASARASADGGTEVSVAVPSRVAVGSPIHANGHASFGADEAVLAVDPHGGNPALPPAADLLAAMIRSDPLTPELLSFQIDVSALVGDSILPGIHYEWNFVVDGTVPWADPSWTLVAIGGLRIRVESLDQSLEAKAHLYACGAPPDEFVVCVPREFIPVRFDGSQGRIGVDVALESIGARPGSVIEPSPAAAAGQVRTTSASEFNVAPSIDELVIARPYRVPDRTVELAVVRAGDPDPPRFVARVPVASDGSFTGSVPTDDLRPGQHEVIARVCWGATCASARSAVTLTGPAGPPDDACSDPDDDRYASYDCKVRRLRERSFVVIAFPDSGINPYHLDFRLDPADDRNGVAPWEYIDGYPRHARALDLSLDAPDYDTAVARDADVLESLSPLSLYYVPGTTIVGAVPQRSFEEVSILDTLGHGTQVASVAAGRIHGIAPDDDVLIVAYRGTVSGLSWATSQSWIDVVSNSWGWNVPLLGLGFSSQRASRAASDAGKSIVFAGGNGLSGAALACDRGFSLTSAEAGPSWVMTVGAVSPRNGQDYCWHSVPVDVSSYGMHWPAADHESMDGTVEFSGTSNAAPIVAGALAAQILRARRLLGDTGFGPREGAAFASAARDAALPARGPLADGVLTRAEAEELVLKTAFPEPFDSGGLVDDPLVTPTTPAYYLTMGYGIVNRASVDRASAVLRGDEPMPHRPDVDQWIATKNAVADLLWNHLLR